MSKPPAKDFVEKSRIGRHTELARLARERQEDLGLILGLSLRAKGKQAHIDYVGGLDTNKIRTGLAKLAKSARWEAKPHGGELTTEEEKTLSLPSLRDALVDAAPLDLHQQAASSSSGSSKSPQAVSEDRKKRTQAKARDFAGILAQIDTSAIASLALDVLHARRKQTPAHNPPPLPLPRVGPPRFGAAHVLYPVEFYDDRAGRHIKWVVKIPAAGTPDVWDRLSADALRSEALLLNLLRTRTGVPVPEVIDADCEVHNEIHVPYLIMEFVEGRSAERVWFEDGKEGEESACDDGDRGRGRKAERRTKILRGVAQAMLELGRFEFEQGGAPVFDGEGSLRGSTAGELRTLDVRAMIHRWFANQDCEHGPLYVGVGPFEDPRDMYTALLDWVRDRCPEATADGVGRGVDELLRLLLGFVREPGEPEERSNSRSHNQTKSQQHQRSQRSKKSKPFVLTHPELSLRNIIVSEDGDIKAILGWDGACAAPRSMGNEAFPRWLVRDFNPFVWRWRQPEEFWRIRQGGVSEPEENRAEDAPWVLKELREEYVEIMRELKGDTRGDGAGGGSSGATTKGSRDGSDKEHEDIDVTKQSLLTLSLDTAVRDPRCRSAILRRILEKCSRQFEQLDFDQFVEMLGEGEEINGYKLTCLKRNFHELVEKGFVRGAAVW
ncbi:hypothetical protein F5B20DRAFT_590463 [Whalleya microplaca]|nr:hypothetical protein F5B20DRAFT_590463 [Whalleya microplaca]